MKRIALWKICLISILCLTLVISTNALAFGEASSNTNEYALETRIEQAADNDQEIQVFIRLTKNSGLDTLELNLSYDTSAFTLTKVENLGLLEGADFSESQTYESNPYYLAWILMDRNNPTSNAVGDLAVLTFRVKNAAEKDVYSFSLERVKGERFPEPDPVTGQVGAPQKIEFDEVKDAVYSSDPLVLSMKAEPAAESGYIDVTVNADSNSGVDAASFCVDYDSERFSLVTAEDMGLLGEPLDINQDFSQERYHCGWIYNPENKEVPHSRDELPGSTGTLIKLKFKVKSGTGSGDYHFSISDPDAGYTLQDSAGTLIEHQVAILASGCSYTLDGVAITGQVRSYDPKKATKIELCVPGTDTVVYNTTITASASGSGQMNQTFTLNDVSAGTYDLVVSKEGHLPYKITGIEIADAYIDLTEHSDPKVRLITLLAGDINGDGTINVNDLNLVWNARNYNKRVLDYGVNTLTDINGDGNINVNDLNVVWNAQNYNKGKNNCIYKWS